MIYIADNNAVFYKKQKLPAFLQGALELMTGFEPVTYALPRRCATTCATSAFKLLSLTDLYIIPQYSKKVKHFFKKIVSIKHRISSLYLSQMPKPRVCAAEVIRKQLCPLRRTPG